MNITPSINHLRPRQTVPSNLLDAPVQLFVSGSLKPKTSASCTLKFLVEFAAFTLAFSTLRRSSEPRRSTRTNILIFQGLILCLTPEQQVDKIFRISWHCGTVISRTVIATSSTPAPPRRAVHLAPPAEHELRKRIPQD